MKFTIERRTLIKMLEVVGRRAPSKTWRDKEVRLSACVARVFVEANESAGGHEALVFEDGTCLVDYNVFLKLLKTYPEKKAITIEANERLIKFYSTTLPVTQFSHHAKPPGNFRVYPVTDDWLVKDQPEQSPKQENETDIKLPNSSKATVEKQKITAYLLNFEHLFGASKAVFFSKFGFKLEKWEALAEALRTHAQTGKVKTVRETKYGRLFEVEGKLNTPDGRSPRIRSVWQLDKDSVAPRLVTAYPIAER